MSEMHTFSQPKSGAPVWLIWLLVAAVFVAGVTGVALGSLAFPQEKIVERPVEITVEKIVEKPGNNHGTTHLRRPDHAALSRPYRARHLSHRPPP